jgi:hypothetical protein
MPDLTAYVAVSTPAGTLKGTIVLLSGDGGTSFFNFPNGGSSGLGTPSYVNDYYHAGYRTVQVAWSYFLWENTNEPPIYSIMDEACRPATLLNYFGTHFVQSGTPMCAQGHSAGAAALGYSMAWYGADRASGGYLDTVLLTAGPALSDIQSGCEYPNGPGSQTVCSGGKCVGGGSTSSWPRCLQYANEQQDCLGNAYQHIAQYDAAQSVSRHTISSHNPNIIENNCNNYQNNGQTTDLLNSEWGSMNLIAVGANFGYSHTFVFGYLCSGPAFDGSGNLLSNNSSAQGWSYQSLLTTSSLQQNSFPAIYRIDSCAGSEMIWASGSSAVGTTQSGFHQSENDMMGQCKVPH